jgi:hypothetical protein
MRAMTFLKWFDSRAATAFASELAAFIVAELSGKLQARDAKFKARAEKTLVQAARRLQDFKAAHALNFWTKSRMANAFLWTLKDAACPDDYADELTEWLTLRL